jgi:hypothetical protein
VRWSLRFKDGKIEEIYDEHIGDLAYRWNKRMSIGILIYIIVVLPMRTYQKLTGDDSRMTNFVMVFTSSMLIAIALNYLLMRKNLCVGLRGCLTLCSISINLVELSAQVYQTSFFVPQ